MVQLVRPLEIRADEFNEPIGSDESIRSDKSVGLDESNGLHESKANESTGSKQSTGSNEYFGSHKYIGYMIMWSSVIGSTESIGPHFNSLTVNHVQYCQ